jgi:hypothetical protein
MLKKMKPYLILSIALSIVSPCLATENIKETINPSSSISYRKVLRENVENPNNKKLMDWFDTVSRDRVAEGDHELTVIGAELPLNYKQCRSFVNIANNPKRDPKYAEGDEASCENANETMCDIIASLPEAVKTYLEKKEFVWKTAVQSLRRKEELERKHAANAFAQWYTKLTNAELSEILNKSLK